jgi:hypothetical protein
MIAVSLDEEQPNGDVVARLFLNGNVLVMMVVVLGSSTHAANDVGAVSPPLL